MSAFTVYFCGTCSNSFDFANNDYHAGELISTLARNNAGIEFVDWIIVDGPGSGNLQEDEKWTTPGNYSTARGTATGAGWEENVRHAVNVIRGHAEWSRTKMTDRDVRVLKGHGVNIPDPVIQRGWFRNTTINPDRKITPQALQEQKVKIFRKNQPITQINVIGWSRGGVTCHMLANALNEDMQLRTIPVHIFAVDPVPGLGNFQYHRTNIPPNVARYISVFARDERSEGFAATMPTFTPATQTTFFPMPGRHATVVGNAGNYVGGNGVNMFFGPGKVVRILAERYLSRWGTRLSNMLPWSNRELIRTYDEMIGQKAGYVGLRSHVYTTNTGKDTDRYIGVGQDWTSTKFNDIQALAADGLFVNWHHRSLFASSYPGAYRYAMRGTGSRTALDAIRASLPSTYRILDHFVRTGERIGPT